MLRNKITDGFVIQSYDEDGNCVAQEFIAGDPVDWENEDGNPIVIAPEHEYYPFHMVQPTTEVKEDV